MKQKHFPGMWPRRLGVLAFATLALGLTLGAGAADPRFVDAAKGDYHLRPNSPCVDAGTDFDGAPRRQRAFPDFRPPDLAQVFHGVGGVA